MGAQVTHTSVRLGYNSGVPTTPFSRLIICYIDSQNSGTHFIFYYLFIIKDTNEQPDDEIQKLRSRGIPSTGTSVSMEFGLHYPLGTNRDSLQTPSFGVFMDGPLCRHNCLNLWPLVITKVSGWCWKFQPSNHRAGYSGLEPAQIAQPSMPEGPAQILTTYTLPRDPLAKSHLISTVENSMEVRWKTKSKVTIWSSNSTPGHISRENHDSKRYMHTNVHSSTIYNSQDVEAA